MPAERAGYTVTMFCIDVSPSMGKLRTIEVSDSDGSSQTVEMTNLQWAMQYVLLKIQEMIFNGRKTDQCGVILFGTEETQNCVNDSNGGYEHVYEYIPIAQPNSRTLSKLQALQPSTEIGDPIDAIIVAIETQDRHLAKKKTWTRKMVVLTDGENPIEIEDWEVTVKKIDSLNIHTTFIGVDFDDEEFGYVEEDKSDIKRENEKFFRRFIAVIRDDLGVIGTAEHALIECRRPEVKETKSSLIGTTLRLGDADARPDEAIELPVKMSKCTAVTRPPSMKKFAKRTKDEEEGGEPKSEPEPETQESKADADGEEQDTYAQLIMQTEYLVASKKGDEEDEEEEKEKEAATDGTTEKVDKDNLIKGFKYGASYAPCPDGQFPRLSTRKGIDICGFFPDDQVHRELAMGEVQYVWADPSSGESQVAFSSIVQAMVARRLAAIARLVTRDEMDPKMGLLIPRQLQKVDCLLWMQMPFADDVRKYTFPSLENLMNKKGEKVTSHPYLPDAKQLEAMEKFVDAMDLMHAGDKDESGERGPWFDPRLSYNPAVHRIKQALFHAAIVTDLRENPLPPPHGEVTKYLEPPRRVVKKAQPALEECKSVFNVRRVPKRILHARKDGHVRAGDDDDELLLLDRPGAGAKSPDKPLASPSKDSATASPENEKSEVDNMDVDKGNGNETEPESDEEGRDANALREKEKGTAQLPSPTPSVRNGHLNGGPSSAQNQNHNQSQSQSQSQSQPLDLDIGKRAGRIIGATRPLRDFQKSLMERDAKDEGVLNQAIEELIRVVKDVLAKPFAKRRHAEMLDCLNELRGVCLKEGRIDTWNSFLKDLKEKCLSTTNNNNKAFMEEFRSSRGASLSLIGQSEAAKVGGNSQVSNEEAEKFLEF